MLLALSRGTSLKYSDCTQSASVMEIPALLDFTPRSLLDAGNHAGCSEEGQEDQ